MQVRNWEDFFEVDGLGNFVSQPATYDFSEALASTLPYKRDLTIEDGPSGFQLVAGLDGTEDGGDLYEVTLTAGQTYSYAYRPTAENGIEDPLFAIFNSSFGLVAVDDDGGAGRSSLLTFTPTSTGTYYLYATSWVNQEGGHDVGGYTLDVWQPTTSPDAPSTTAGAFEIAVGETTFGHFTSTTDADTYTIDLEAGNFYNFLFSGGVAVNGEQTEAGSVRGTLQLLDANGNVIATHQANESVIGLTVETDGTYYIRATRFSGIGGYTLDVSAVDLASLEDQDPLEAFNWDTADNVDSHADTNGNGIEEIYVYFAAAGENFGETQGDNGADGIPNSGDEALLSYGWNQTEINAVMLALDQYEHILGVEYLIVNTPEAADFRLITTKAEPYGARFYPQDPAYGTQQGIGTFNVDSGGWDKLGVSGQDIPGDQLSLQQGGFAFAVILHEFGHAHGIAHPHDNGGDSEILAGVVASQDSYGVYNLNQGVYTVMSYNDAWDFHPNGPSAFTIAGIDNGWSGTLSAFDIAVLQQRYGVTAYNEGDNNYALTDVVDDAFYQTIWDSGGDDTISYGGNLDARIDLTAATLDYSPTGGGVISFLLNDPDNLPANSLRVRGGYTIANDVVIENATGGAGDDVLIGNAANNVLTGNGGVDVLMGRDGNDRIIAGAGNDQAYGGNGLDVISLGDGNDTFYAEAGTKVATKTGTWSWDIVTDFDASGDDLIDVSNLGDFHFIGTNASKEAGELSYKSYTSIQGAEKALGIDIDGQPGAGGISGPVTIVYANTDGGSPDVAIVLLNTSSVDASDFYFG
jgi:serralysin